jgi:hypothetical protein
VAAWAAWSARLEPVAFGTAAAAHAIVIDHQPAPLLALLAVATAVIPSAIVRVAGSGRRELSASTSPDVPQKKTAGNLGEATGGTRTEARGS